MTKKNKSISLKLSLKIDDTKYKNCNIYKSKFIFYTDEDIEQLKLKKIDIDYSQINKKTIYG